MSEAAASLPSLPPLLFRGRSAHESATARYARDRTVRFGPKARFFGFVGVASRHGGVHAAAVVIEGDLLTVVARIFGSFHALEHDLFTRTDPVRRLFDSPDRCDLYYDTLETIHLERMRCADAGRVRALPRTCFVATATSLVLLPCLVPVERVTDDERRWFGTLLRGMPTSEIGMIRARQQQKGDASGPMRFRFVFQRADCADCADGKEGANGYGGDALASIDAILLLAQEGSEEADEADGPVQTVPSAQPDAVRWRPMPAAMPLAPPSLPPMVRIERGEGGACREAPFFERLCAVVLGEAWERRMVLSHLARTGRDATECAEGTATTLFDPPIALLVRRALTHELVLHTPSRPSEPIDVDEVHRLLSRYGIVVGWDQQHDDVFRVVPRDRHQRQIAFRPAKAVAEGVLLAGEQQTGDQTGDQTGVRRALKRLRSSIG